MNSESVEKASDRSLQLCAIHDFATSVIAGCWNDNCLTASRLRLELRDAGRGVQEANSGRRNDKFSVVER